MFPYDVISAVEASHLKNCAIVVSSVAENGPTFPARPINYLGPSRSYSEPARARPDVGRPGSARLLTIVVAPTTYPLSGLDVA
jgi:hypothetical protein